MRELNVLRDKVTNHPPLTPWEQRKLNGMHKEIERRLAAAVIFREERLPVHNALPLIEPFRRIKQLPDVRERKQGTLYIYRLLLREFRFDVNDTSVRTYFDLPVKPEEDELQ